MKKRNIIVAIIANDIFLWNSLANGTAKETGISSIFDRKYGNDHKSNTVEFKEKTYRYVGNFYIYVS